jgi:hypothetical protein
MNMCRGLDPLTAELDHVADLVQEQENDEPDRERNAEEEAVGGDRDQHRAEGGEELQLREQEDERLRLREEDAERSEGAGEPLAKPVPARAGVDRFVAVSLARRRERRQRALAEALGHGQIVHRLTKRSLVAGRPRAPARLSVRRRGRRSGPPTGFQGDAQDGFCFHAEAEAMIGA